LPKDTEGKGKGGEKDIGNEGKKSHIIGLGGINSLKSPQEKKHKDRERLGGKGFFNGRGGP